MTLQDLRLIVARVEFRDWLFECRESESGDLSVRVTFVAPCRETGAIERQSGRAFFISRNAIADEVLKTCWLAVEIALRHEALEEFTVDGKAPFNPHHSVEAMLALPVVTR